MEKRCVIFLISLFFLLVNGMPAFASNQWASSKMNFQQLEKDNEARIGLYALDMENGHSVCYRADERFAYCSLFKVLLVGEILRRNSLADLDKNVSYTQEQILSYAPVTAKNITTGMTISELCSAAIRVSDNTAANLLLNQIGGIEGFKQSLLCMNDMVTQPVRNEPTLNTAEPGVYFDTSTPRQLAVDLEAYTLGSALSEQKRKQLIHWMSNNRITDSLIRAAVPIDWKVADKSGSGGYGTRNDMALIMRPEQAPILIVVMTTHLEPNLKCNDTLVAAAAKIAIEDLDK